MLVIHRWVFFYFLSFFFCILVFLQHAYPWLERADEWGRHEAYQSMFGCACSHSLIVLKRLIAMFDKWFSVHPLATGSCIRYCSDHETDYSVGRALGQNDLTVYALFMFSFQLLIEQAEYIILRYICCVIIIFHLFMFLLQYFRLWNILSQPFYYMHIFWHPYMFGSCSSVNGIL